LTPAMIASSRTRWSCSLSFGRAIDGIVGSVNCAVDG
jgi:hypothetical protein